MDGPDALADAAPAWEARRLGVPPEAAVRWGVVHVPTRKWVAFGSEARCRRVAAQLTEVDTILGRHAPSGPGSGSPDA
jgi:hypothetical protein